jgi:hypothetical protein
MKRFFLLASLVMIVFGAGCSKPRPVTPTFPGEPRGVSLSPDATANQPFAGFFTMAKSTGKFMSWAGPVSDLEKTQGAPRVLLAKASEQNQTPIIILSPTAQDLRTDASWALWSAPILTFLNEHTVPYIGIGNELNKTLTTADFSLYTRRFTSLAVLIRQTSTSTKVFPIFQYEWLSGNRGGLFGGKNDDRQAQWSILENFGSADLIAFTTYPGLIYRTPGEIPTDYYSQLRQHTTAPVAFTEIGWARSGPKGWESSVSIQAQFVDRFFTLTQTVDQQFTLWAFLFDPQAKEPFSSMGLLSTGQSTSPTWEAWTKR